MSESFNRAMEAGFAALKACRERGQPGMEESIRKVMLMTWQSDMLCSLRLGDPPKSPLTDPRWYGLEVDPTRATIGADEVPPQARERLLDLPGPGRDGVRGDGAECVRAVAGDEPWPPRHVNATHAARIPDAGRAEDVAAEHSTLTAAQPHGLRIGDTITIAGVLQLDRRWWPRLRNWLLRRPPPRTEQLHEFRVSQVSGSTAELRR